MDVGLIGPGENPRQADDGAPAPSLAVHTFEPRGGVEVAALWRSFLVSGLQKESFG